MLKNAPGSAASPATPAASMNPESLGSGGRKLPTKAGRLFAAIALATVPFAGAGRVMAQPADTSPARFAAQAEAMLEAAYPGDGPGAAAIVTRGGRVLHSGARGLAELATSRPITPDTAFRLGSITKQFTAAIILQMVGEGRLSLDDPISRFFPDYPQPGARATVRQLLNHTSGIQDYTKIAGWMGTEHTARPFTTAELMAVIRARPSPSEPGQRWEYNNSGYVVLGAIIEKIAGKAWHEVVTERIARPLGLRTIAYGLATQSVPAMAHGYSEEGGRRRPARGAHISVAHAAGGLVGSAADLAKWAEALHGGRVVSPALYQEMIRPARLADGSVQPYGFGLRLREIRGRPALVHGGAGRGLDTDSAYVPSERLFVAVLANSDDPSTDPATLVRRLAALALGDPFPNFSRLSVDMRSIEPLFGLYSAERGPPLRFFTRDGKLYMGRGDDEMEAFPAGEDRFFFGRDALAWFRVAREAGGAHVMELHRPEASAPLRAVRSGPAPIPFAVAPAVLRTYAGTYSTEALAVTVALAENGRLTITPAGQRSLSMRPVSETEFRVDQGNMRVVFHAENGEANRITIHRGARQLHGQRVSR